MSVNLQTFHSINEGNRDLNRDLKLELLFDSLLCKGFQLFLRGTTRRLRNRNG